MYIYICIYRYMYIYFLFYFKGRLPSQCCEDSKARSVPPERGWNPRRAPVKGQGRHRMPPAHPFGGSREELYSNGNCTEELRKNG